ncbi:radical SAM protein [Bradyrhizobium arachidis]|uniref:SPASM domain-containing protein n=1 Tax=Bradyrhizobium arachidis TaxID=858423 RepID=UPI002162D3D7|nr:radical SAM protein [Bradyrhizobium arachidis]UVO39205.1 radical SAM protein [Bradyrhizobium arachidis]
MKRCAYPWQQMIIDLTGEVVPCCYWSGYGNFGKPLGNTNSSSLDEIWHGQAYRELREKVASDQLEGHPCGNCLAYRSTGTFPGFSWPVEYAHESGFCYLAQIPESFVKVIAGADGEVKLLEDGEALSGSNALHEDIRKIGRGRFSVWKGWLYFSSSDNADPIESGRRYQLAYDQTRVAIGGLVADSVSAQNLKTAHQEYEAGKTEIVAEPSMISLISTADCNIDCPGCSQNVVRVTKVQHRPETVPSVLAKVPYLTQFIWHGGEPYLIKKFRSFIDGFETADNPNLTFGFTSNGTMITPEEVRKLAKFPRINASVSIDSFNPATFEQIRAGAKFDRVWSNFKRLLDTYDSPRRVYSVGMIVCKSNMPELADNIKFAIEHDIGLNLSPVVIYPVTEQLNVFSDFSKQTKGWQRAIIKAMDLVIAAKQRGVPAVARVDPEGMLVELERLLAAARDDYSATTTVVCEIEDPYDSLGKMRRPTLIAYINGEAKAYAELFPGAREALLRVPRKYLQDEKMVRLDFVHDVMEPASNLSSGSFKVQNGTLLNVSYRLPPFTPGQRPRNINWANYGDATPDGHHIKDPLEIFEIYRKLYAPEFSETAISTAGYQRRSIGLMKQLSRYVRS